MFPLEYAFSFDVDSPFALGSPFFWCVWMDAGGKAGIRCWLYFQNQPDGPRKAPLTDAT